MKGYMTVEASLLLPMVFGVLMFVLSLLFYSYDRCLLEQDVTSILVGSGYGEEDVQEIASDIEREIIDWYLEKYVWMDVTIRELVVKDNSVRLAVEGKYNGPFFKDIEVQRQFMELSPTFWLRQKNKLEKQLAEE